MKILMLTGYFFDGLHKEFSRNKTGLGLLVTEIMTAVGAKETVVTETFRITDGFELVTDLGSCNVRCHSKWMIIKHLKLRDIIKAIDAFLHSKKDIRARIHEAFYWISAGVIRNAIREEKPDIVHVHDMHSVFIDACETMKVPYVVTQHGLNGFREDIGHIYHDAEKAFFEKAYQKKIPVTVISTGMKNRIEKMYLNGIVADNIAVVTNGTNISRAYKDNDNEERARCITVIGSICHNKNQQQIVEAVNLLGDRLRDYCICICGVDRLNGLLQNKVKEYGLEDRIRFMGFLTPEEIAKLLEKAELNVMASKDEGFGISMIEGFVHGVPSVTFEDLYAVPDIYDEKAMVLCRERSDKALAEAIEKALITDWDREYIRKHAEKFSLQSMADRYIAVYKKIIQQSDIQGCQ